MQGKEKSMSGHPGRVKMTLGQVKLVSYSPESDKCKPEADRSTVAKIITYNNKRNILRPLPV